MPEETRQNDEQPENFKNESKSGENQPDNRIRQRFYPLKPKTAEGFKKAVAWLGGRELVASLKGTIIYAIYGENMDPRSWMKPNIYPNVEEKINFQEAPKVRETIRVENGDYRNINAVREIQAEQKIKEDPLIQKEIKEKVELEWAKKVFDHWEWKRKHFGFWEQYLAKQDFWENLRTKIHSSEKPPEKTEQNQVLDEFWFDYISDTGDGQMGVYGVGCMCFSDLWLTGENVGSTVAIVPPKLSETVQYKLLPRGTFLFVGGDTAYHSANYATLFERFQTPFRWAFMSVRKLASKRYVLKKTDTEKFFLVDGKPTNVFQTGTTEPVEEWDGTIGSRIGENLYWDTEPLRPLFGVPANHDYYDSIDGFNKQFRRAPFEVIEENMVYDDDKGRMVLQIPTFSREQEASYIAIRLPFDWWMFGIDSENEKLDYRQEVFFKQIMKRQPKKLILTTPEPTTVFGKPSGENEKTATYLKTITQALKLKQPFLNDGRFERLEGAEKIKSQKQEAQESLYDLDPENDTESETGAADEGLCRLDLSGDIHHYARYWGENTRLFADGQFSSANYASVVAGGGGAFFDPTETLIGEARDRAGKRIEKDEFGDKVAGEIPPQRIYPGIKDSRDKTADRLFDLWNIKKGGYVQTAGAVFAVIIYAFLMYFSNASNIYSNIRTYGVGFYVTMPANFWDFVFESSAQSFKPFTSGFILTASAVLVAMSCYKLNSLIAKLKEKSFEAEIDENYDGRVSQLLPVFYPFLAAIVLYEFFLAFQPAEMLAFTKSYFLLVHFIITGLLIWLSMEYSNWLPVSFKIIRSLKERTFTQIVEDPNVEGDTWYKKVLGQLSREYSYKYFPSHLLVIFAVFVLVSGIRRFGNELLAGTFADLLLITVVLGGFALIAYVLAVRTGAAYVKGKDKFYFFLIGTWQAILQILTPFIFYFYTNIWLALALALLVLIVNGLPVTSERLKIFSAEKDSVVERRSLWYRVFGFQAAAKLMKSGNRALLTAGWIVYGLVFLVTPFLVARLPSTTQNPTSFSHSFTLYQFVDYLTLRLLSWTDLLRFKDLVFFAVSVAVVAYLGFYLSRVWFSWYLAVSLAFNGHNNEAGGAARIEGFKHILRVRVEKSQLTVYVIGIDEAKPDIEELQLKLVDKFTIGCQPQKRARG